MRPQLLSAVTHLRLLVACVAIWGSTGHHAFAQQREGHCVYERDPVSVSGEIHRKRFKDAGDAGYGTPRKKTAVLLKLRHPLCVMLPDDVTMTPRPRRVHEVQLLSDDKLPRTSDKRQHVEGIVVLAQDEDHYLPVLIEVQQLGDGPKAPRSHR